MPVLTMGDPLEATQDLASPDEWLVGVQAAFVLAVRGLEQGEIPSKIRPGNKLLTEREWQAVLEAARREVTTEQVKRTANAEARRAAMRPEPERN